MKHIPLIAVVVATALQSAFALAQETPTRWAPIEKSMMALLNEGWRITSYTNSTALPDVFFTFLLSKESKVVICIVDNPRPNNAISRCRALN